MKIRKEFSVSRCSAFKVEDMIVEIVGI